MLIAKSVIALTVPSAWGRLFLAGDLGAGRRRQCFISSWSESRFHAPMSLCESKTDYRFRSLQREAPATNLEEGFSAHKGSSRQGVSFIRHRLTFWRLTLHSGEPHAAIDSARKYC
jgi:hypothetical protein